MKKRRYWFKIDNAGKVFPAISNQERSNVFRLSMSFHDDVKSDILEQAVNLVLPRFEVFAIKIKTGLFWQYFDSNQKHFKVEKEPAVITRYFHPRKNQHYLFKVYFFNNRVTLETFHALTDGSGSYQFLLSIAYEYLTLLGHQLDPEDMILGRKPLQPKESEDAFISNYDPKLVKKMREEHAFHLKNEAYKHQFSHLFSMKMSVIEVKKVAKKYGATITQYLASVIVFAMMRESLNFNTQKKPLKLFIPINLRPYFHEVTLRNFSMYLKTVFYPDQASISFEDIIEITKTQFQEQLTKESLVSRLSGYVSLEKKLILRMMPFFIKNIAFKIGYDMLGAKINTASFSNLGQAKLPSSMKPYISDINFIIGGFGLGISSISYEDTLQLNLATRLKDHSIMRKIVDTFHDHQLNMHVYSNYEEEYDAIL